MHKLIVVGGDYPYLQRGQVNIFYTALYQNGGKELIDTLMPAFNSAAGVAALKSVADLIHVEKISPLNVSVDADLLMFQQGSDVPY